MPADVTPTPAPTGLPHRERCLVMGVVNVTPDSFSDGGQWPGAGAAVERGLELVAQGADIVDVGGESTRPGAQRVPADEELRRVIPVIEGLARENVPVSVDTMRAEVAQAALDAGAHLVNDVSGGLADPDMPRLVARAGVPYVVVHWRGHSHQMHERAVYTDVVAEVCQELRQRVDSVISEGVDPSRVVIDPGLGFAKHPGHNWALLAHLDQIARLGGSGPPFPVLVGASRKRFLGSLLAEPDGTPRPFAGCDDATAAVSGLAAAAGAWCVRVHEVPANADAVRAGQAWRDAAQKAPAHVNAPTGQGTAPGTSPELDRVTLSGLRVFARHGVTAAERRDGQEFVIDAVLWLDIKAAAAADDLSLTVDYAVLAARLAALASGPPVRLIETLADQLAFACLADPLVATAEVTVHKPQAPLPQPFGDVAVTARRSR